MEEAHMPSSNSVEPFPEMAKSTTVSDELNKILLILRSTCPPDAQISFDFDGQLHAHMDLKTQEQVTAIEIILPMLGNGLFRDIRRSATPHHLFFHRVSVIVDR